MLDMAIALSVLLIVMLLAIVGWIHEAERGR